MTSRHSRKRAGEPNVKDGSVPSLNCAGEPACTTTGPRLIMFSITPALLNKYLHLWEDQRLKQDKAIKSDSELIYQIN